MCFLFILFAESTAKRGFIIVDECYDLIKDESLVVEDAFIQQMQVAYAVWQFIVFVGRCP